MNTTTRILTAVASVILLLLGACASTPDRPVEQMTRAEAGIEAAEQAGARDFASDSLANARDNFSKAERASERGNREAAIQYARQAELDAELATAETSRAKAAESLKEINDSIETLRQEVARDSTQ